MPFEGILNPVIIALQKLGFTSHASLGLFMLIFARLTIMISLSPFFGLTNVPPQVKSGFALVISILVWPAFSRTDVSNLHGIEFLALLMKELLIGIVIGLTSQFIFAAIQMAGSYTDTQRGMDQTVYYAPQMQGPASVLSRLKYQAALALFLTINGHLLFLKAVVGTFLILPPNVFPAFQGGIMPVADKFIQLATQTMGTALALAAPMLISLFVIDIAFSAVGKVASQVQIHSESQPVKALSGLIVLALTIGLIAQMWERYFLLMISQVTDLILRFR